MKPLFIILATAILFLNDSCKNNNNNNNQEDSLMEITGTIKAIEMTSWQYGTHTLSNEDSFYALRSENVDLENYEGQIVTVKARKIEGYPVDGGPEYLEVEEVEE